MLLDAGRAALLDTERPCHGMWLFHLHNAMKRKAFSLVFPLTDSLVGDFAGYSLGIERNKASAISYGTAYGKRGMESSADMAGYANGWSGGEREQAAYVGMARQPMVLEPEADGPEQVGPQDDEKEREQAFPALRVFVRRFGGRRGEGGIIRGEVWAFRLRQQFEAGDAPRFGYPRRGIERRRAQADDIADSKHKAKSLPAEEGKGKPHR